MTLAGLAWRNLLRRPLRSALSTVGISLAVASAIALVSLSRSIDESARSSAGERGSDLTVTQRGATDVFGGFLPAALESKIAGVPGVAGVASELAMFAASERNREVLVVAWSPLSYFWRTVPLAAGRLPHDGERRVALVGDEIAATLGKHVGDRLEILGVPFRIVGLTKYQVATNRGLAIVPLADLQEVSYREGQVTLFHIRLAPGLSSVQVVDVENRVARLGLVTVSMTSEMLHDNRYVAILNAISLATSSIALAIGVLNVLNTLVFTIQERTREIGILAAIGWSARLIATSVVIEGMALCIVGCMLGVALGFLASLLFGAIPVIGDYLSFTPSLGLVIPTLGAAIVLCFVGTLYPAWRAIRYTPAEALQRA